MTHRIRDVERRRIRDSLKAANRGDWRKIASEIDYDRNQIYFWFLLPSRATLESAVEKAMRVLKPFAFERPGVDFTAGFIELTETRKVDWETVQDEEIRDGYLNYPVGSRPWDRARPDTTVFDRPDYFIPPADEPI